MSIVRYKKSGVNFATALEPVTKEVRRIKRKLWYRGEMSRYGKGSIWRRRIFGLLLTLKHDREGSKRD